MLQGGGGYPGAKAGEMLRLLAALRGHPLDPDALLERLGLPAAAGRAYKRLSGGQQQRLSLAMAVVGRPELVFLDEPTAGLDPQARHATWDAGPAAARDGVTVVLTTHYMEEAERLADQVVVVDRGRVVAAGSPAELTRHGAEGQLRFTAPPGLDLVALAAALPPAVTVSESRPGDYLVTVPGPVDPQLVAAVTAWCADKDVLAEELRVRAAHPGGRVPRADRARPAHDRDVRARRRGRGRRPRRMLAAQARMELRLSLRNGEQVLLTLVIPLLLLRGAGGRAVHPGRRPAGRLPRPGRARARGDVGGVHRRWRSRPASSASTACSSGSAHRAAPLGAAARQDRRGAVRRGAAGRC